MTNIEQRIHFAATAKSAFLLAKKDQSLIEFIELADKTINHIKSNHFAKDEFTPLSKLWIEYVLSKYRQLAKNILEPKHAKKPRKFLDFKLGITE